MFTCNYCKKDFEDNGHIHAVAKTHGADEVQQYCCDRCWVSRSQIFASGSKVVIKAQNLEGEETASEKSASAIGLYIPKKEESADDRGVVVSIGPDCKHIEVGNYVLFRPQMVDRITFEEDEFLVIEEIDILGKVCVKK